MLILGIRPDLIRASRVIHLLARARRTSSSPSAGRDSTTPTTSRTSSSATSTCRRPTSSSGATGDDRRRGRRLGHRRSCPGARRAAARRRRLPRRHEHGDGLPRRRRSSTSRSSTSRAACAPTTGACRRRSTGRSSTTCPTSSTRTSTSTRSRASREGLNPRNIVVVQNLIVDVLEHYYFDRKDEYEAHGDRRVLRRARPRARRVLPDDLPPARERRDRASRCRRSSTCSAQRRMPSTSRPATGRRSALQRLRTRRCPTNVIMVDPIGYDEMLALLVNSRGAHHRLGHGRRGDGGARRPVAADAQGDRAPAGLRLSARA